MVKLTKFPLIFFFLMLFVSGYSSAEDNPDLNPDPEGGAVFVSTPTRSEAENLLKAKGWKKGRNDRQDGSYFYISIGYGEISTTRDDKMIHDARYNAFIEAFTEAKSNYVRAMGEQITKEVSIKTYENLMPDTMAEDAINSAVGTDSGEFDKLKKLISLKFDSALKKEGYNPELADAEKRAIQEKILRSREINTFATAAAQSMVEGFQSYRTYEGGKKGERGSITVVAIWSPKLKQLAKAVYSSSTTVPKGKAKKPIKEQLILDDPNVLLASFGVKMFTNEIGNMVLVSYGHASPSFENDPGALSSACDMAESKAKENIVTFAKEQIVFSSMRRETDKIETFERAGMEANRSMNGREFNDFINSKSAMKLEGYNIIGTYPIRNTALYNSTDCVAVVQWSPEGVEGANIIKKDMSSSTSSNSSTDATTQDVQSTTSGQTSSDDF